MCGRTALTASPADLREAFGLDDVPELAPHYNVPPSRPLEVVRVRRGGNGRHLEEMRWGLVPTWAKDPKIGNRLALARAETAATTAAFRDAFRWRRCLVAVDGFYEWHRAEASKSGASKRASSKGTGPSTPYFVRRADHKPFALAGLWSRWTSPDGEVLETCAIVTQPARPPLDAIHDRMPLVLEPAIWDQWLDPQLTDATSLAPLLEPRTPDLVAYPVSPHVNDPRHDDPSCLEPAAPPEPPAQASLFDR
jgi:putative SOS response-associated peptidase YedK